MSALKVPGFTTGSSAVPSLVSRRRDPSNNYSLIADRKESRETFLHYGGSGGVSFLKSTP